jgi:hypothetical protein
VIYILARKLRSLLFHQKQEETIGGRRTISNPGPQKGHCSHLNTWEHEIEAVCVCVHREEAKAGLHLSVGVQQEVRRGRASREEAGKRSGLIIALI